MAAAMRRESSTGPDAPNSRATVTAHGDSGSPLGSTLPRASAATSPSSSTPQHRLTVRVQLVQVGKQVVEGTIKTEAGQNRVVALSERAVAALLAWQFQQGRKSWHGVRRTKTPAASLPMRMAAHAAP